MGCCQSSRSAQKVYYREDDNDDPRWEVSDHKWQNPSQKSILEIHPAKTCKKPDIFCRLRALEAISQTLPETLLCGIPKIWQPVNILLTFCSNFPIFWLRKYPDIWPFRKSFMFSRLGFSASCIYIILYHIMNYTIYIICFPLILNL